MEYSIIFAWPPGNDGICSTISYTFSEATGLRYGLGMGTDSTTSSAFLMTSPSLRAVDSFSSSLSPSTFNDLSLHPVNVERPTEMATISTPQIVFPFVMVFLHLIDDAKIQQQSFVVKRDMDIDTRIKNNGLIVRSLKRTPFDINTMLCVWRLKAYRDKILQ